MGCGLPDSSVHEIAQARILEWVVISFSRGSFNPGIEPGYPALQADSLPSEPPGKAANEGNEVQRDVTPCSGHLASLGLNFLNHFPGG